MTRQNIFKYDNTVFMDGVETEKDVDVSAKMDDARTGIWTLYAPDFTEVAGALEILDQGTVRISVSPALPEGLYFLLGIA